MRNNDRKGKISGRKLIAIVAVFILAFAFFARGPWSGTHVAGNPGAVHCNARPSPRLLRRAIADHHRPDAPKHMARSRALSSA
jgi:hypothetical protein